MNKQRFLANVAILFFCIQASAQDSTSINNQKKIEELKARINKLYGAEEDCPTQLAKLKELVRLQSDSIRMLSAAVNANTDSKTKYQGHLHLNPCSCVRVYYDLGKYSTDYKKYIEIDSVVSVAKKNNYKIKLIGHSDKIGPETTNQPLSAQRAEDLKRYMIKNFGLSDSIISIEGHGSKEHIKEITDPSLFHLDRRVEIYTVIP